MRIRVTNHCGAIRHTAFKLSELFQNVLRRFYYAERIFERFPNQIQLKYYGVNRSVSIEGISLKYFIALPKRDISSTTPSRQRHSVFHYFYLTTENRMLPLTLHTASV